MRNETEGLCFDDGMCYAETRDISSDNQVNIFTGGGVDSKLITIKQDLVPANLTPATEEQILHSITSGATQGITSGIIGHIVEKQTVAMLRAGESVISCNLKAVTLKSLLYFSWILSQHYAGEENEEFSGTTYLQSAYETMSIIALQELFNLITISTDWLRKKTSYKHSYLSQACGFLHTVTQAAQFAVPAIRDPISSISCMVTGTLTKFTMNNIMRYM